VKYLTWGSTAKTALNVLKYTTAVKAVNRENKEIQ
jgi:hypothetical protein